MSKTKIIELIYTEERKGTGIEDDPIRMCPQLWTKDGELIAESDMKKNEDNFFLNLQELKKDRYMGEYKNLLNLIRKDIKKREAKTKEFLKEDTITELDYEFEKKFNKMFLNVLKQYIERLKDK